MTLRLEYAVTGKDISESLSCRLADPLWMIARQWQVGEFDGEDAGSAILARVSTEWLPLDEAGPPGHAAPLSGSAGEAVVEAESEAVREDGIAYSIEVGTRLLRRLSLNGLADVRQKLCERFPFSQGALDLPSEEDEEVLLAARSAFSRGSSTNGRWPARRNSRPRAQPKEIAGRSKRCDTRPNCRPGAATRKRVSRRTIMLAGACPGMPLILPTRRPPTAAMAGRPRCWPRPELSAVCRNPGGGNSRIRKFPSPTWRAAKTRWRLLW